MNLAVLKHEIIDNEIANKRIRTLWLALLIQNTILFIFYSYLNKEINEINSSCLFINEFILALLNVISFVSVLNYRKGVIKTINSEIEDELLPEKQDNDVETQASNDIIQENETSSADIVNKFLNYYEQEEKNKNEKKKIKSASFSSDDENYDYDSKFMKNRSQVN